MAALPSQSAELLVRSGVEKRMITPAASGDMEIAVIGAGAAGIGAARALAAAGASVVVLEASSWIGGRARTVQRNALPLDLGCGWLHSARRNPWTEIASQTGFTVDRTPPKWERQSYNVGFTPEEQKAFSKAFQEFDDRVHKAAAPADTPAAAMLDPQGRWNALLQGVSTYLNGAALDEISLYDLRNYEDDEVNWRVEEGYGALIAAFAGPVPVVCDCAVTTVNHGASDVRLETSRGERRARKVIVTVSTNVLAGGGLKFVPELPQTLEAASNLPLGLVNKVFIACDVPFAKDGHLFGNIHSADTGSYHLRPFGRPYVEGFFGGALARELAREDERAIFHFAANELFALLGSDLRRHLKPITASAWHAEPHVRGAYSYAKVGQSGARAELARSVEGRLFFAGEATSPGFFSTAHGAYLSGVRAAKEALST